MQKISLQHYRSFLHGEMERFTDSRVEVWDGSTCWKIHVEKTTNADRDLQDWVRITRQIYLIKYKYNVWIWNEREKWVKHTELQSIDDIISKLHVVFSK